MIVKDDRYTLYNGDCLEIMDKLIEEGVVFDAIITDPPYGATSCKWDSVIPFDKMWDRINKLIKPNGAIVLFGNEPFSSALRMSNIKHYRYDWKWVKPNATTPSLAKIQPMRRYEDIIIFYKNKGIYNPQFSKGKPYTWNSKRTKGEATNIKYKKDNPIDNKGVRYPTNILEFNQERGLHSTQKPIPLLQYLVKTYTNENDCVLDFTFGSCSTGVACLNTNRKFIGIELDKEYFEIGVKRMKEASILTK